MAVSLHVFVSINTVMQCKLRMSQLLLEIRTLVFEKKKRKKKNGLLCIATQCWIVHETLKQEHTIQNYNTPVTHNIL